MIVFADFGRHNSSVASRATIGIMKQTRPDNVPADRVIDFDVNNPRDLARGFHESFEVLQQPNVPDLVWTPRNEGHWLVTSGKLMMEIFPDFENFSNRIIVIPKSVGELHQMLPTTLDPPDHRHYRVLLNAGLSAKVVNAREGTIRGMAARLIDGFAGEGHCNFVSDYAEKLPIHVFLGMVDLPLEDAAKLKYWSDLIVHPDGSMSYADAAQLIYDYLDPYIERRLKAGGDDLLSQIVNGQVRGQPLTKAEMQSLCMQALIGGIDTVVNFLGFVFRFLGENADKRSELADNPGLIPAAIEEFLRRFPVVNVAREVRHDLDYAGVHLKKGDVIMLASALVGTDERMNHCPLEVDFHRTSAQHGTFGKGLHFCPGAFLARTEVRITIEEWLKRIPDFQVAPGADVSFCSGIVGGVKSLPLVWDPSTIC